MEWIQSIMQWAKTVLEQVGFRPVALPLAFVLGLASAVASACCTLPLLGASFGKSAIKAKRTEAAIRIVGGILLISAGFYLLWTF
ncbi:MAG: hypothetical protein ACYSWQ_05695 [Planctomycetota bacterium]|jgi:cytochrome c biogenesis protein CcdA